MNERLVATMCRRSYQSGGRFLLGQVPEGILAGDGYGLYLVSPRFPLLDSRLMAPNLPSVGEGLMITKDTRPGVVASIVTERQPIITAWRKWDDWDKRGKNLHPTAWLREYGVESLARGFSLPDGTHLWLQLKYTNPIGETKWPLTDYTWWTLDDKTITVWRKGLMVAVVMIVYGYSQKDWQEQPPKAELPFELPLEPSTPPALTL